MKELIDYRNSTLWDEINSKYNVTFHDSHDNYGVYSINNDVTFYINKSNLCIDSFTHEMLHVYFRLQECYISSSLKVQISQSKILSSIFSEKLIEHIGNCLEHIKMLPLFLEMGFDRTKFIVDYYDNKCSDTEVIEIKQNFKICNNFSFQAIDLFIGKIFAMAADPNNTINYSTQYKNLSKIDLMLYQINMQMISHWTSINLEDKDILNDDYNTVVWKYYENLKRWITKNRKYF